MTLCVFAFAFLFNTQTTFAQGDFPSEIKTMDYKKKVESLASSLQLSAEQIKALAGAYVTREKTYNANLVKDKVSFEKKFEATIEGILTKAQFEKFKAIDN